jgi:uncharacterized protein (DUF58 family)
MADAALIDPLATLDGAELEAVARVAERMLAGRPLYDPGPRPVAQRAGVGLEFLDCREYAAGDDPRRVDWRASARTRTLQVRRYHHEAAADWMIALDRSASMAAPDARQWAHAAQLAAAFAYVLLAAGNRVGLVLFSERVDAVCPPGRGQRHYASVAQLLRAHPPAARGGASRLEACASAVRRGASLAVISDFLTEDAMQTGLVRLRSIVGSLHALNVRAAEPQIVRPAGIATLVDVETGEELTAFADEDRLRDAAAAHDAALDALCARLAIALTQARAGENWKAALLAHLLQVGARRA